MKKAIAILNILEALKKGEHSIERLSIKFRLDQRTITRYLADIREAGYKVEKTQFGMNKKAIYKINVK